MMTLISPAHVLSQACRALDLNACSLQSPLVGAGEMEQSKTEDDIREASPPGEHEQRYDDHNTQDLTCGGLLANGK